ncbi:MAG: cyanophycin synthetase [Coriobacteriia bacterium]|nr:cyanophycin synthetase [Coriobacteriia bacterium]
MPENFDPVEYINTPRWRSSRLGLDRTRELLAGLGNPQDRLRVVHVAGTNGKGSTCAFLASILQEAGYKVGLFTSPYIIEFADRIRVNGQNIPADDLLDVTLAVREVAEAMPDHPTEFELMTAVAFTYFAREECDICVVEVGLGGRLDSTNVLAAPEVCVITPIALDHTTMLGDTIAAIAGEKAGIVKPGVPVVSAVQTPEAMGVIAARAVEQQAPLTCVDADQIAGTPNDFGYRGWNHLTLGMLGSYQTENAATALEAVRVLRERGWEIPDAAVEVGLATTYWPGRFEILGNDPTFIVDGGHNPQGVQVLIDSLEQRFPQRPVIFVMGVLADKDYPAMVRQLVGYPFTRMFICIEPPNPRALPTEDLAQCAQDALQEQNDQMAREHPLTRPRHEVMIREAKSIPAAVEASLGIAFDLSDPRLVRDSKADPFAWLNGWSRAATYVNPIVVACGSLYSVADITAAYDSLNAGSPAE